MRTKRQWPLIVALAIFCASCAGMQRPAEMTTVLLDDGTAFEVPKWAPPLPEIDLSLSWKPAEVTRRLEVQMPNSEFNARHWVICYHDAGPPNYSLVLGGLVHACKRTGKIMAVGPPVLFIQEQGDDMAVHSWRVLYAEDDPWRCYSVDYTFFAEGMGEETHRYAEPREGIYEEFEAQAQPYMDFMKQFWDASELPPFGTGATCHDRQHKPQIDEIGLDLEAAWPDSLEFNRDGYTFESAWDPILIFDWPIIAADPQPDVLLTGTGYCLVANPGMVDLPNVVLCELYGHTLISYAFFAEDQDIENYEFNSTNRRYVSVPLGALDKPLRAWIIQCLHYGDKLYKESHGL
ncbi:MAG: hypothetical protein ACYTFZ_10120 [Planctomycetota bacterium]|jgi:hypothetical protein